MEFQPTRSDNKDLQCQPRMKYGSRPPESAMSDAEVSQWLLEAEQEDRRLAAIEQAEKRRAMAEKFGLKLSTNKQPASAVRPRFHRGCKYRLPSADPIAIPTIPYDPLDIRWRHQDLRRRRGSIVKKAPKKSTKALRELAEDGFDFLSPNDGEDDSDDSEFGEQDGKQCPICNYTSEVDNQKIEIAVDKVTMVAVDQKTENAVDQEVEITVDQVTVVAVDQKIENVVDQKIENAVDQEIEIAVDAVAIITSTNTPTQDTQSSTTTATGRPTGRTE